jgi:hypothetical protein
MIEACLHMLALSAVAPAAALKSHPVKLSNKFTIV